MQANCDCEPGHYLHTIRSWSRENEILYGHLQDGLRDRKLEYVVQFLRGDLCCEHGKVQIRLDPADLEIAAKLAEDPVFLKSAVARKRHGGVEERDISDLFKFHKPAIQAHVVNGGFATITEAIRANLAMPAALLSLLSAPEAPSCITQAQVDLVFQHLLRWWHTEAAETFAEGLPSTWNLDHLKILLQPSYLLQFLQNYHYWNREQYLKLVHMLASKRILALLSENGISTVLCNMLATDNKADCKLILNLLNDLCSGSNTPGLLSHITSLHVDILLHILLQTEETSELAKAFLEKLPEDLYDAQLTAQLSTHFTVPALTATSIVLLKHVIQFVKVKERLFNMGIVATLVDALCAPDTSLAEPILEVMHALASAQELPLTTQHVSTKDCATLIKARVQSTKLPLPFQQSVLAYLRLPPISRDENAPWYINPAALKAPLGDGRKYTTLPAPPKDIELVANFYQRCPAPGYDIKSVTIVYNEQLFLSFAARVDVLQARKGNKVFDPHWLTDSRISQDERAHRQRVMDQFCSIATHKYNPDVYFTLGWHGTSAAALVSLFTAGFANLASTDAGFFGKGLYTTPDADYAFRVYNSGALLLNWVATFSPFPVIAQDEPELAEMGNYRNYDSHFVPVFNPNHPRGAQYHACERDQVAQYSELVVFEAAQMLAHYIVELQPNMPLEIVEKNTVALSSNKHGMDSWTVDDVCAWVATLQLSQDYSSLLQDNSINGEVLQSMSLHDWKDVGVESFDDSRLLALKISRYENYSN